MPGINGIFEPFKRYVQNQLNKRREIITSRKEGEFLTYTSAKTCYLRMVSGVNISKKNDILESRETPGKLNEGLAKQYILEGGTLYYNRLNDGAPRESFTEGTKESAARGFTYGDEHVRADAGDNFGVVPMPGITDAEIRTKTPEGSLREAIVNFECHNRRQLQVLEALYMRPGYLVLLEWGWTPYIHSEDGIETEMNGVARKFLDPTKVGDTTGNFFNKLNQEIIIKKKEAEGNYDGFIGIVKNFKFTSKPDGGYQCTTELIAQGEILESLRSTKQYVETDQFEIVRTQGLNTEGSSGWVSGGRIYGPDVGRDIEVIKKKRNEILDNFLLYLKAIKHTWDKAGDEAYLQLKGTDKEKRQKIRKKGLGTTGATSTSGRVVSVDVDNINYIELQKVSPKYEEAYDKIRKLIKKVSKEEDDTPEEALKSFDETQFKWEKGWFECLDKNGESFITKELVFYSGTPQSQKHWKNCKGPREGGIEGKDFRADASLGGEKEPGPTDPNVANGSEGGWDWRKYKDKYPCYDQVKQIPGCTELSKRLFKYGAIRKVYTQKFEKDTEYNKQESGLQHYHKGLIVIQKTKYIANDPEINSGWRKNVFVRWDLVCQIFNHLSQNKLLIEDTSEEPIAEMTYLAPKQQTYDFSSDEKIDNTDTGLGSDRNSPKEYISYQPPKGRPIIPGDLRYDAANQQYIRNKDISILGSSLNDSICLLPHQELCNWLYTDSEAGAADPPDLFDYLWDDGENTIVFYPAYGSVVKPFTSYKECNFNERSIGGVLFNVDFLISEYETIASTKQESTQTQRMKPTINFNKYFNTIWEEVNGATGHYYDFGLHIEHERPHVGRIIDFTFSGETRQENLFTFKPQLDGSVVRDFQFNSEIPADMSSVISIAAQAPNDVNDLDSLSFKAFNKGIHSRFSAIPLSDEELAEQQKVARETLKEELEEFEKIQTSLAEYYVMFNNNKFFKVSTGEKDKEGKFIYKTPLTPEKAIDYIEDLEELRITIENKYPLYEPGGIQFHPKAGLPRPGTTYHRSTILPIKYSAQLDGIGGITPLTLFKVDKNVLPIGYQADNVLFIVKEEKQTITSGQDWTTEFSGQLVLMDTNPNFEGQNLPPEKEQSYFRGITAKISNIVGDYTKSLLGILQGGLDNIESVSNVKPTTRFYDPIPRSNLTAIGDGFPLRNDRTSLHAGIDVSAPEGTPIYATRNGIVKRYQQAANDERSNGGYGGYGKYIILTFDEMDPGSLAEKALFAHLSDYNEDVKDGDSVVAGKTIIGYVGNTGDSSGPHLHYEVGTRNAFTQVFFDLDKRGRLTDKYYHPDVTTTYLQQIKDIFSDSETNQAFYLLNAEYFTTYYGNAPQIKRDNYVEL